MTINLNNIIILYEQSTTRCKYKILVQTPPKQPQSAQSKRFLKVSKRALKDKNVQLIGFGTFSVTKRAARDGINPQTQEKIRIKASKTVKFKAVWP